MRRSHSSTINVSSIRARCEPGQRCGPPPKPQCRCAFPSITTSLVEISSLLDDALAIGERLAALPAQALRASKVAMNMHLSRAALGILEYALAEEYTSFSTPVFQERVAAFRARSKK